MTRPRKPRDSPPAGRPPDPASAADAALPAWLSREPGGRWLIRVKAVPGASRDEIAGTLGDRLKIRIAAPPEAGRANNAVRALLARRLGIPRRDIELTTGASSAEKVFAAPGGTPRGHVVSLGARGASAR